MSDETTTDTQPKRVEEYILDVLSDSAEPLPLDKLAKQVSTLAKTKFTTKDIEARVESHDLQDKVFRHLPKGKSKTARYWTKSVEELEAEAILQAEEKAAEKKRVAEEKVAEKKRAADEKAAEKKRAAEEKVSEAIRQKVLDKVAELGDSPVPESKLGKPTAKAGASAMAVYDKVLKDLQDEHKLYAHGAKYGKHPPRVVSWFELAPHKKSFDGLVKAARKVVDGGIESEQVLTELRRRLSETPASAPATAPPPVTQPVVTQPTAPPPVEKHTEQSAVPLRDAIKSAYDELRLLKEFRDGLVEIPRLYHELKQSQPNLTVEAFHAGLDELAKQFLIELHGLNEVSEAWHREWAIERNGRLLYYVRWR